MFNKFKKGILDQDHVLMYIKLKKELKVIRKKRGISKYIRWCESRKVVDEFYRNIAFSADTLYDRSTTLKRNIEGYKLIGIPIYIALVFGVFVTMGFKAVDDMIKMGSDFLNNAQAILKKALLTLSPEAVKQATETYNKIVNQTLLQYCIFFAIAIILLILIALLLWYIPYQWYRIKNSILVLYEYELGIIQHQLDTLESQNKINTKTLLTENNINLINNTSRKKIKGCRK